MHLHGWHEPEFWLRLEQSDNRRSNIEHYATAVHPNICRKQGCCLLMLLANTERQNFGWQHASRNC
ncbi:MAG: hypothetical protein ACRC62_08765 [Microcoleus sp.]